MMNDDVTSMLVRFLIRPEYVAATRQRIGFLQLTKDFFTLR